MAKLVHQTDRWGNKEGQHYIELSINGRPVQIVVTDDMVEVFHPPVMDVRAKESSAVNCYRALMPDGQFKTMYQYHYFREYFRMPKTENWPMDKRG